ncbi:MAG: asparagine synthase (glutamine-hydrolyzing) [Rhodospirillaceae bacterium]|nr:asparagine synthase (glutamine-hydrolyzing) [Rhodospirillaceae bacterium]
MCGIVALFAYHPDAPPIALGELLEVNKAMMRRGPDGGGHWISDDSRVGLAHRRLAIIDPDPRANQPMAADSRGGTRGRFRITYNGEIYNFRRLREALVDEGVIFVTQSDTEVLLRLYERDGAAMVKKLRGMFALAIWDEAERQLFLARDPFGIKPLYYADDGRTLRLASQVKALLAGGHAGKSGPDAAGHAGFFLFGSVPDPHTLYADIHALPAGHTLTIQADGSRHEQRYFNPVQILKDAEAAKPVSDELPLREMLLDSVRHHFVADVPVGVFLSAGLDSTTITALASESQQGEIRTFTLGFDEYADTERDEVPLAEDVAKRYDTSQSTERLARLHFDGALPDLLKSMDQPSIDGVNTYFVAQVAAHGGLKVALSGLGGDELFAGYDTFTQVPKLVRGLGWMPGIGSFGRGFRAVAGSLMGPMLAPKYAGLFEFGGTYPGAYLLRRGLYMPWELPGVMDPDLAAEGWRQLAPLVRLADDIDGLARPANRIRVLETCWYMKNQLLRDADWAGMAHSLEIRVPFVDADLFRAAAPAFGAGAGPSKLDMAATPIPALPPAVLNKPKTGFFVPVDKWLRRAGTNGAGLRGWARKVHGAQSGKTLGMAP